MHWPLHECRQFWSNMHRLPLSCRNFVTTEIRYPWASAAGNSYACNSVVVGTTPETAKLQLMAPGYTTLPARLGTSIKEVSLLQAIQADAMQAAHSCM
jgi:hypothetical protein